DAEDLVPGVYELDVVAPPLSGVTATVRAALAPWAVAVAATGIEASTAAEVAGGRATATLLGAERSVAVSGRGAPAESVTVRVRFLLAQPRAVGGGTDVHVVAGGRSVVPLPRPPALTLPEGFTPLIEVRIHPSDGIGVDAVRRLPLP